MSWTRWAASESASIRAAGRWRSPRAFDAAGPAGRLDARDVVSFASNDYLGLTCHPAVVAAAHAALDRWGTGAGASRLVVGSRPVHHDLEHALADWKHAEASVVFPTGYAANLGVLTTFAARGVRVLSDELNHASLIDGCRLARADVVVYRHGDADHAAALLAQDASAPAIVVTDTVFSMDGDVAPLAALAAACRRYDALLVVDDAHAVFDPDDALDGDVLRVGTLSKTLGALGGFVAGPRELCDLVVNRARTYIFTTALPPADAAAALAALDVVRSAEGAVLLARLRAAVDRLRPGHPSPILPIVVGDDRDAVDVAARLLDRGLLVPAIRPPTVPAGTARLRVTVSAAHTDGQLDQLVAGLDACWPAWRVRPRPDAA